MVIPFTMQFDHHCRLGKRKAASRVPSIQSEAVAHGVEAAASRCRPFRGYGMGLLICYHDGVMSLFGTVPQCTRF